MPDNTSAQHRQALATRLGAERVSWDDGTLAEHSRDYWSLSALRRMQGRQDNRPLCVVTPENTAQVSTLLEYANTQRIPVVPFGAGSGVCGAVLPDSRSIVVDLRGMNRILELNENSLYVRVQAGMMGGVFEAELNKAKYSARHFPQSIDVSTVGGWVATRAAGQYSTRYGNIEDILLGVEGVLPDGRIVSTRLGVRSAAGPDLRHVFLGAEGTMGIITEVTLRLVPLPETTVGYSFSFASMDAGLEAIRKIMRDGWRPPVVRLYDAIEAARLFPDVSDTTNALLLLLSEGPRGMTDAEVAGCSAICTENGGTSTGAGPVERWSHERNHVPGFDKFLERGLVLDTIEVASTWDRVGAMYREVVAAMQNVPGTLIASGHSSHSYAQGTNIYFTFVAKPEDPAGGEATYLACWAAAMEATLRCGGTIAHHHGIGRLRRDWMKEELGSSLEMLRALKRAIDPNGIMNPGVLIPD